MSGIVIDIENGNKSDYLPNLSREDISFITEAGTTVLVAQLNKDQLAEAVRYYPTKQLPCQIAGKLGSKAIKFDMGECPVYKRPVVIESRDQMSGDRKWVLKMHEWVMDHDGNFQYEPSSSSRTDKFIADTRFNTPQEAYVTWKTKVTEARNLAI